MNLHAILLKLEYFQFTYPLDSQRFWVFVALNLFQREMPKNDKRQNDRE